MQRLLLEMRRRKVLRVAGTYTVAGWVVLQVTEMLVPALSLPEWTMLFVALLLLLGLPIAMALAWVLHGPSAPAAGEAAASEAAVSAGQSVSSSSEAPRRWMDVALLAAVVLVVAVSAFQVLDSRLPAAPPQEAAGAPERRTSIAVLPFASFTNDAEDGYFADGLTEELINSLTQLEELQVPGRTSSFYFKNRNEDLREIGRQLGVAHVLEGSVRRAGEQLRVTVQLVSTTDGFHLWSRTYDRELTDVFAIQQDIANQVAATLKLTLLSKDRASPEAAGESYPSFLIATALLRERTPSALTEARRLFEDIISREPDHVEALAGYARATMVLAGAFLVIEFEPAADAAVKAVERALALEPDSVAANLAAGTVYDVLGFRTDEQQYLTLAERALSRAMDLAPADPEVLRAYGSLLTQLGRWETALEVTERGVASDPLDRAARFQYAQSLRGVGRLGDARAELERLLESHPDYVGGQLELGELLVETGNFEDALPYLRRAHGARTSPRATFALAHLYLNLGMAEAVRATLAELDYAPLSMPLADMVLQLMTGDGAAALQYARAELDRTGDRIWRPLVVLLALISHDLEQARAELRRLEPAVLAPEPDISRMVPMTVLLAADLLEAEGQKDRADRLLEALLARFRPPQEGYDPAGDKLVRAQALAMLGRADEAMADLEAARLQGFRTLYDFDHFMRLDRYPSFAVLRADPRFRAWLAGIDAANRAVASRLTSS